MTKKLPNISEIKLKKLFETRYGENPHLKGAFFVDYKNKPRSRKYALSLRGRDPLPIHNFKKIQGKQISFNNLLDVNAAVNTLAEIENKKPNCVIIKHGNPCGVARGRNVKDAFLRAWEGGDSLAAFGGVIAINKAVDENLAKLMIKNFFEVLVASEIKKKALKVFSQKPNLIILANPELKNPKPSKELDFKKIRGGFLIQEPDLKRIKEKDLKFPTKKKPTKKQIKDLLFAWKICKISKSNAIVLVKDETLISSGVGQQDRKRCCDLAVKKAGKGTKNTVAASDGFFPFSDAPEILIKAGIKAIVQPGGSLHDKDVIKLCDKHNIPMVFTKIRCFKH